MKITLGSALSNVAQVVGLMLALSMAVVVGGIVLSLLPGDWSSWRQRTPLMAPASAAGATPSASVPNTVSSQSGTSGGREKEGASDGGKHKPESQTDAIANVMAAVSAALAAVAMIFSVGIVWLGNYLQELSRLKSTLNADGTLVKQTMRDAESHAALLTARFEAEMSRVAASLREEVAVVGTNATRIVTEIGQRTERSQRVELARVALLEAKVELNEWVRRNGSTNDRVGFHAMLMLQFEQLTSPESEFRLRSFEKLSHFLTPDESESLPSVVKYTEMCHAIHGGESSDTQIWCKIFSRVERAAYVEKMQANQEFV